LLLSISLYASLSAHNLVDGNRAFNTTTKYIGYLVCDVLTPGFMNITACSPLNVNRRFGGKYRLLSQGRISRASHQRENR
jgi:hypothetical protein